MTEEFKVLDDRSHIFMRPSMYIGSISLEPHSGIIDYKYQTRSIVPGLMKIISEILDNSVDEYIRTSGQFATKVNVSIDNTVSGSTVTIQDNGRGIPVKQIGDTYQPVLAWTQARAGSNFGAERSGLGANGVGSFATNIFSKEFIGTTSDGENKIVVSCSDNCKNVSYKLSKSKDRGTTVSFVPDLEFFGLKEFSQDHIDFLKERITNLAISYPGITFRFNGEKIDIKNLKTIAKNFSESSVVYESDKVSIVFAPSGESEEFRLLSYVNGLDIKNGGSHVDYILEQVIENLRPAIKRKWKIEVLPNQIKQHLLLATWITGFPNLKFDSQSKERITNSKAEVVEFLAGFSKEAESIAKKIISSEGIIMPMIEAILHKKELQERRDAAAKMKKLKKKHIANHLEASGKNWEEKTLYLAEGLSAIGGLLCARNPETEGGYALRGKVMNTHGMRDVDILKNKELSELLHIIGLDLNEPDYGELNYGRIAGLVDEDFDGKNIFCLLMQFFSRWPKLFEEGRIVRIITPLYIARKKGDAKWYYSQEEYENRKDNLSGYEISYNKGLGSLREEDYLKMIKEPNYITVYNQGIEKLDMAFGDSADLRKDWMMNP